ncbi:MAG: glutamine synthetase family protein [Chloroflexota bacterium]|nr:glutamine synthetase family protein [Chloroflexota bacterium]
MSEHGAPVLARERADSDAVLAAVEAADLRLVRFLYCDYGGIVRGKATHAAGLADRLEEGIALTSAQMAMNALDQLQPVAGMTAVGEVRLVPDPASFVMLPYVPRTGAMMCDLLTLDREPSPGCPRSFLQRVLRRADDRGMSVEAVFEHEFFLGREVDGRYHPADRSLCFSTVGMNAAAPFTDELIAALEAQGLRVEQALPEYGAGQQEISIRHAPALAAADNQIVVRETAKAVAARHGMVASFAAKPFPDQIGSGAHVHLSLWDIHTGDNLLYDPDRLPHRFSELGAQFVAGVLDHLPALTAITCPTVNSYRRLQPHAWASAFVCYGFDNREAAVRVPSTFWGREQGTTNLELKTVDNTCNPYLALGAIITAGLDGIERRLDPGPPLDVDPGLLTDEERERRGMRRLPGSLDEALDELAQDKVLGSAMGEMLREGFLTVRRSEAEFYRHRPEEDEFASHYARY